jgi:plasmanylethanolamine desaturase
VPAGSRLFVSPSSRAPAIVLLDAAAVTGFAILLVMLAARLAAAIEGFGDLLLAALLVPPAILVADVVSGLVHWWGDTFFDETTPVLGPLIIRNFRAHHDDPAAMTAHGFLELNGASCLALVPPLAGAVAFEAEGRTGVVLHAFLVCFALVSAATNHLHKWAHASAVPDWIGWAQRRRLVLSPDHHARHHAPPHRRSYCVATGWANPWLDRVDAFPRLERAVRAIRW